MAIISAEDYFIEGCKNLSVKHQKYPPFYQNSKGDDFKAKELFEKSADLGFAPAMRELGRCYIEGYGIWIKNKLAKGHALLCKAVFAGDVDALKYYWEKEYEYRFADIKGEDAQQNHHRVQQILLKKQEKEEAERKAKAKAKRQAKKEAEHKKQEESQKNVKVVAEDKKKDDDNLDTDIVAVFENAEDPKQERKTTKGKPKTHSVSKSDKTLKKTIKKSTSDSSEEDVDNLINSISDSKEKTTKGESTSNAQPKPFLKSQTKTKSNVNNEVEIKVKEESERKAKEESERKAKEEYNELVKEAEQGNSESCYKLYEMYLSGSDYTNQDTGKAMHWLEKSADAGKITAMLEFAICYERGESIEQNPQKAFYWYQKAAVLGDKNAMYNLGNCFYKGLGVNKDLEKATHWYQKAADNGNAAAMYRIGCCYRNGKGIKQDDVTAVSWFLKAAEQDYSDAMTFLGVCYRNGWGVVKNDKEMFSWWKKGAKLGNADSMNFLGTICYYLGQGVEKDYKKAFSWTKKSAELGNKNAVSFLAACYIDGVGVSRDVKKSIFWYEKIAETGDTSAMNHLGHIYCNEEYHIEDYSKGFLWFKKSAEFGNTDSQSNLGWCYQYGKGTLRDLREAVRWYNMSNDEFSRNHIEQIIVSEEWQNIITEDRETSAIKGTAEDALQLGLDFLYAHNGLLKNIGKSMQWFQKSAEMGNTAASAFMSIQNPILDLANIVSTTYEPTNCEIKAPIGHQYNGKTVEFNLDINKGHYHAFVIGETGSGKSRFLHDIIISIISEYSPEDVELYLMDFKGVEFNPYRDIKHSRVVLVDRADERITYEVISELKEKMQERQRLLASSGASDIYEYNKSANSNHLSQIILVVDECQTLFTDRSKNSRLQNEMVDIIALIAQQGRAYGVHLLMATQSLANAKQLGNEILNQIGEHYILPCLPVDAARLVPDHERRMTEKIVAQMEKGKGQCYYQGANGKCLFTFNYIAKGEPQTTYINLARNKSEKHKSNGQIYFSGSLQFTLNKDIIDRLSSKGRDYLVASPGQNIDLKQEPLSLILRNDMSENVMLLGINDKHYVTRTALNLLASLIAVSTVKELPCKFYVFDCYDDEDAEYIKVLDALEYTGKCQVVGRRNRQQVLYDLCKDIANNNIKTQKVLLILGEENFRELKLNAQFPSDVISPTSQTSVSSSSFEDTLAMMNALSNPITTSNVPNEEISHIRSTGDAMEYILCKGPDFGIFTIMQLDKIDHLYLNNDGYVNIKNVYEKFKHFIILRSNEKDIPVLRLPDEIRPERLEDNPERLRAYYYNDGNGKYSLFTPYTQLTQEQINILI